MTLFGHKNGLIISFISYLVIALLATQWIGESISYQGYARYIVALFVMLAVAFFYENSISKTINKLDKVNTKLEKITRIDGLTTLYNRRYFNDIFPIMMINAHRNKRFLVFAMIDVDYFKLYNDNYGHQAGDEVLKLISLTLKEAC
jgi:predicted signal transduction protein with EAL and GGDEF domain